MGDLVQPAAVDEETKGGPAGPSSLYTAVDESGLASMPQPNSSRRSGPVHETYVSSRSAVELPTLGAGAAAGKGSPSEEAPHAVHKPFARNVDSLWTTFRRHVRRVVAHKYFERVIITLIMLNLIGVASFDPLDEDQWSTRNVVLDIVDTVFQCLFTVEMIMKVTAYGLYRPRDAYLKDAWNVLDCCLVLSGWATYQAAGSSNLSVGRLVRILRPLRTISMIPGLKLIIVSMIASIPQLLSVLALCAFIFFSFGIAGIQMFGGVLRQQCYFPPTNGSGFIHYDLGDQLCDTTVGSQWACPVVNGTQTLCLGLADNPNDGISNFDNIGSAFLTIFQVITQEGWTDLMYYTIQATSMWSSIYYVLLIICGSLFVLNLALAVISLNLSEQRVHLSRQEKADRWQQWAGREPTDKSRRLKAGDVIAKLVKLQYEREAQAEREAAMKAQTGSKFGTFADAEGKLDESGKPVRRFGLKRMGAIAAVVQRGGNNRNAVAPQPVEPPRSRPQSQEISVISPPRAWLGLNNNLVAPRQTARSVAATAAPAPASLQAIADELDGKDYVVGSTRGLPPIRAVLSTTTVLSGQSAESRYAIPSTPGAEHTPMPPPMMAHIVEAAPATTPQDPSPGTPDRIALVSELQIALQCLAAGDTDGVGSHIVAVLRSWDSSTAVSVPPPRVSSVRSEADMLLVHSQDAMMLPSIADASAPPSPSTLVANGMADVVALALPERRISHVNPRRSSAALQHQGSAASQLVSMPPSAAASRRSSTSALVDTSTADGEPWFIEVDEVQNSVMMRVPHSHRFGPFPYSPAWRWICFNVVRHPAFERVILAAIVLNTLLLAMEYHGMPAEFRRVIEVGNICMTATFIIEMVLKLAGLSVEGYASDSFNLFDGSLVVLNIIELGFLDFTGGQGSSGLSALRTFRLFRVVKLLRSFKSLNIIITNIVSAVPRIGPFSLVLLLLIIVYALLGMQLFGGLWGDPDTNDRPNFDTLLWSFVSVFQILTQENWNDFLYRAIDSTGYWASLYFVTLIVIGNYLVLNLFLAILIDNFKEEGDGNVSSMNDAAVLREASQQILRLVGDKTFSMRLTAELEAPQPMSGYDDSHIQAAKLRKVLAQVAVKSFEEQQDALRRRTQFTSHKSFPFKSFGFITNQNKLRRLAGSIVVSNWFDSVVLVVITGSCVMLTLDSVFDASSPIMAGFDAAFTAAFTLEMVLKMFAFGMVGHPGSYFRDGWNIADFVIVMLSIVGYFLSAGTTSITVVKVFRFFRALRPLRVVRRLDGLRLIVSSVVRAMPHCFNVALVSLLVYLLFGILGVNMYGGRFYSCSDPSRICYALWTTGCPAHLSCEGMWGGPLNDTWIPRTWDNPNYGGVGAPYSFDSSWQALLTLFEVSNLELWSMIMQRAADVTEVGWAPVRNANQSAVFFFIVFVVIASFFMMNLFVSVVVDNFTRMRNAMTKSAFVTPSQRRWIEMQSRIMHMSHKSILVPQSNNMWRMGLFQVLVHSYFEVGVALLIVLNVGIMAIRYADQPDWWDTFMDIANTSFSCVFALEAILKIFAFSWRQYWNSTWNRLDFVIVTVNTIMLVVEGVVGRIGLDLTLLRVIRVIRIVRLVKASPALRSIFTTLYLSLPSLGNVGALLLLVFFMFAVAGMTLFSSVPHGVYITDIANFEDFVNSFLLLVRMATGENWNGLMHECLDYAPWWVVYLYFMLFIVIGRFIMLNLFVAVILENFEREMASHLESEVKTTHLEQFAEAWASIVLCSSKARLADGRRDAAWISVEYLPALLTVLDPPLGLPSSQKNSRALLMHAVRVLDVPMSRTGMIHFAHTLRALVRRVCGEDLPTDMDHDLNVGSMRAALSNHSSAQLFAARFLQTWVHQVFWARRAPLEECSGILEVEAVRAYHLPNQDYFGIQDPYVVFRLDNTRDGVPSIIGRRRISSMSHIVFGSTETVIDGGTSCSWAPHYNGTVRLPFHGLVVGDGCLKLWAEVWDDDVGNDDLIGVANIPLFKVMSMGTDTCTVHLTDTHGARCGGELVVSMRFSSHHPPADTHRSTRISNSVNVSHPLLDA